MKLTLSVRSFHTPDTPSTRAWPPRMPSVPTSRATRVTSAANERSWSTIVLMVSFSSRISPRASTVIFFERSPCATAVVTSAMLRTWSVRLSASVLTLSVRSFHVPETPSTLAWPPSLPSVPTSFATRVTSSANERSWSTIVLIVFLSSRISPLTSTVIFLERSPVATAVVTSAMFRTCAVRLAASVLTLSVRSFHDAGDALARRPGRRGCRSVPTSRATRVTSPANVRSVSIIELIVSASSATSPCASIVNLRSRSPLATAVTTRAIPRTCVVRFEAMKLTLSVRSFQVPLTPLTRAWPPSLPSVPTSRATRVTSSANEESWSTIVLIVFLSSRISPLTSTLIFLREVAGCDRGRHLGDVAHLRRQVRRHQVDVVGEVLPDAGDALDLGLAAELAFGADLARDARDLVGERGELVDHRVDGRADAAELAAQRVAVDLERPSSARGRPRRPRRSRARSRSSAGRGRRSFR